MQEGSPRNCPMVGEQRAGRLGTPHTPHFPQYAGVTDKPTEPVLDLEEPVRDCRHRVLFMFLSVCRCSSSSDLVHQQKRPRALPYLISRIKLFPRSNRTRLLIFQPCTAINAVAQSAQRELSARDRDRGSNPRSGTGSRLHTVAGWSCLALSHKPAQVRGSILSGIDNTPVAVLMSEACRVCSHLS